MEDPSPTAEFPDPDASVELLRRARRGDTEALDRLWALHRPRLLRWAHGRLPLWARDALDTQDLVQETLLHAVRHVEEFEPHHSGAFGAYLRQALHNRIRDEIRKRGRRPAGESLRDEHHDPGASPVEQAIGAEALRRYEEALARLGDDDRALIVARIEMGSSFEEVAATTGRPSPDAARMAVSRALLRLATEMDHE